MTAEKDVGPLKGVLKTTFIPSIQQHPCITSTLAIKSRWYHGGLAGMMAACCTHPLDLVKVNLQTVSQGERIGMVQMVSRVVKTNGFIGLYSGLTASLLRQVTWSTTRFSIYEGVKNSLPTGQELAFHEKILLGAFAGFCGGLVGTPADLINVRMQNDVKIPPAQRRNYKHAVDGLYQVYRHEGMSHLWSGASMASARAAVITVGQLSMYDTYKGLLLKTQYFTDSVLTHFTASVWAGATATLITMPLDVMKTRMMNAPPGMYHGLLDCAKDVAKMGPSAFFKGITPAFVRLAPHTILMFLFFEQLRLRLGYVDQKC